MERIVKHFKTNVIAYLALFVALGGTSYAAVNLPANSVGARQLKTNSVSAVKLDRGSIAGYVRDWAVVGDGTVFASRPQAHLVGWTDGGGRSAGIISWGKRIPKACFALASSTPATGPPAPSVEAGVLPTGSPTVGVQILTSAPAQVAVAVICPAP